MMRQARTRADLLGDPHALIPLRLVHRFIEVAAVSLPRGHPRQQVESPPRSARETGFSEPLRIRVSMVRLTRIGMRRSSPCGHAAHVLIRWANRSVPGHQFQLVHSGHVATSVSGANGLGSDSTRS